MDELDEDESFLFRERMNQFALQQAANKSSLVLSRQKYEAIVSHLMHPRAKIDPQFKHWVKQKKFSLAYVTNDRDPILTIPNLESRFLPNGMQTRLQVVHAEQIVDIVYDIHTKEFNHAGYKKILDYVQKYYYGITRAFLQEFTRMCPWCAQLRPTAVFCAKPLQDNKDDVMEVVKVISKHEREEREEEEIIMHHIDGNTNTYKKIHSSALIEELHSSDAATFLHKVPKSIIHLNSDEAEISTVRDYPVKAEINTVQHYPESETILQDESDDVDRAFVNYLIRELKSIKNPSVKKKLKKKLIDTVLEFTEDF